MSKPEDLGDRDVILHTIGFLEGMASRLRDQDGAAAEDLRRQAAMLRKFVGYENE